MTSSTGFLFLLAVFLCDLGHVSPGASRAALMRSETAALRISRFSSMAPLSKLQGAMDVNSKEAL